MDTPWWAFAASCQPAAVPGQNGDERPDLNKIFQTSNLEMLRTGRFADASIHCGTKTWHVHTSIVCSRSEYFEKALTSDFEEGMTASVTLRDHSESEIDKLLNFIYTGTIVELEGSSKDLTFVTEYNHSRPRFLELGVALWLLGDYFLVRSMKEYAMAYLIQQCDDRVFDAFVVFVEAETRQNIKLGLAASPLTFSIDEDNNGKALEYHICDFLMAVKAAYEDGPERSPPRLALTASIAVLMPRLGDDDRGAIANSVQQFSAFGQDLCSAMLIGPEGPWVPKRSIGDSCTVATCRDIGHMRNDRGVIDPMSMETGWPTVLCWDCIFDDRLTRIAPWRKWRVTKD